MLCSGGHAQRPPPRTPLSTLCSTRSEKPCQQLFRWMFKTLQYDSSAQTARERAERRPVAKYINSCPPENEEHSFSRRNASARSKTDSDMAQGGIQVQSLSSAGPNNVRLPRTNFATACYTACCYCHTSHTKCSRASSRPLLEESRSVLIRIAIPTTKYASPVQTVSGPSSITYSGQGMDAERPFAQGPGGGRRGRNPAMHRLAAREAKIAALGAAAPQANRIESFACALCK